MASHWSRRRFLSILGGTAIVSAAGCLESQREQPPSDGVLGVTTATQFSSPGCSCCGEYATYLREYLDVELDKRSPSDVNSIKQQYGVPDELLSCHTLVLDDFVVEGHVPVEAIATALDQQSVSGIALPGMPAGSPGMPGEQTEPFTIYEFSSGTVGDVFTEL
ncbi:DUF411 domain-containing protein [Haloferax prahovense]|uniref:DUF411 domain-containing protein n=1 Tax=Haloferax prahovense TaxID=381852 RepID=UPI0009FDDFE0|nr:DUF411 domain-containing protein [Haloferax prahovense]